MITKKDVEEVLLKQRLLAQNKIEDAEQKYNAPDIEQAGLMMWAELPDEAKAEVRRRQPELAKRFDEKLKRGA